MKNTILLLVAVLIALPLTAMDISGNPKNWTARDFIGFDRVGDTDFADISSTFAHIEDGQLFFRVTFTDMTVRRENRATGDTFANTDANLNLLVTDNAGRQAFTLELAPLSVRNERLRSLRSPGSNMVEIVIPWNGSRSIDDIRFDCEVTRNNRVIEHFTDPLTENGRGGSRGGNCAFVHHGNQGLTYTEVFYGQFPQETSGFDEVLEVHQATGVPGNFHMSGTLMPAAAWHNPEFNDWIASGVTEGYCAMLSSALGQHIMPFVQNDMNNWSVSIENDMVNFRYGYEPHVVWVPERVWLNPGQYPEAGVIDWLGDNWTQHGINAVILDDSPHLWSGDNHKIHWMNNDQGITLRCIPIDNEFVGNMHYDASGAMNRINSTGQYGICVYGTDWEVAAEMNEHHDSFFLDNYESVLWYCHDNYPATNVWALDAAINNADFNGGGIDITPGTYGLCGGGDGYGGSNNSWYTNWAGTASHSDYHDPAWNYGTVWNNAYENIMTAPDNNLAQLAWYVLMINLHETAWHTSGEIADWEHRYSAHIKNANVYAEAARWANGDYIETSAAYLSDVDRDGVEEIVMHNDKIFAVFESIGGRAQWMFCKNATGNACSVVGSDVAYYSETDGDYNESSNNHFAALSDVSPNYQHSIYDMNIVQGTGDELIVEFTHEDVTRTCVLQTGNAYLDVTYSVSSGDLYVKSGWSPDLLDLIWSGKSHVQRMWGNGGEYAGRRNSSSGATAAFVMGSAGGSHNGTFEGTLVVGDEIVGGGAFRFLLYAGFTSDPYDDNENKVVELDNLADLLADDITPTIVNGAAYHAFYDKLQIVFSEDVVPTTAENIANYALENFSGTYHITSAVLTHNRKVTLTIDSAIPDTETGIVVVTGVEDMNGNAIQDGENEAAFTAMIKPHLVGTMNNWTPDNHDYDLVLANNLWTLTVLLDAGTHEYKIIESEAWDGNDWPAENQTITLDEATEVTFWANCGLMPEEKSGDEYVCHSTNPPCVVGNILSALGGIDWDETTTLTYMNDDGIDGDEVADDGRFSFRSPIPQGEYELKIVLNNNWDQSTSDNLSLVVMQGNIEVLFIYDMVQNRTSCEFYNDVSEGGSGSAPSVPSIDSIYPNPFNPETNIGFSIPSRGHVRVEVFNIRGQRVKQIADDVFEKGNHRLTWHGDDDNGKTVGTGLYLFKLEANGRKSVKRAMMIK